MARHQDDNEQYSEARDAAFQLIVARLVAEGADEEFAELMAKEQAEFAAEAEIEDACDNAEACLIGRHEFA